MLILKQNTAASVPTPAAGKGTIFLSDSDVLSVKKSSGAVESFPTIGGSNTQVIFNDSAALGGDANFTFNKATDVLTVTGNVGATRVLTNNLLYANGVAWDLQQPAGANTQVIFNDEGDFGADATFTFDQSTDTLSAPIVTATTLNGLLATAAQTNITTVGTLGALTVTGAVGAGSISATGAIGGTDLNMSGNAIITGNLTVNGTTTSVNVDSFEVEDPIIELGGGPNGTALTSNDGKDRGQILNYFTTETIEAFMGWDNSGGEMIFASDVTNAAEVITVNQYANVHGNVFIGSGAGLSAIVGANVTGAVPTATAATTAGTVTTAAQPNITSVGTLSSLLAGASASASDFSGAAVLGSVDNTGENLGSRIGLVGEAAGDSSDVDITGIGVYGVGASNGGTRGTGIFGLGSVTATGDTGAAVGIRGITSATHAGGMNVGLYGKAEGSSINNYALYIAGGGIGSIESNPVWELNDDQAGALKFSSSGKANIFMIETTDNSEGISSTGYLNVTGNITAIAGVKTDNLYYANGAPWDLQQPAGANTQVIFNDEGDFGADSTFTFNKATNVLSADTVTATTLNGTLGTASQTAITAVGTLGALGVTNNILAGNVFANAGTIGAGSLAGSLTTAAQTAITSVGTLGVLAVTGNITSGNVAGTGGVFTYVKGDGANLSAITGANVTGQVTNSATANAVAGANVSGEVSNAATANAVAGANVSGAVSFATTANAVAGANVSGTVASATTASTASTVTGAAQANITSVGTLSALGVNGTVTAVAFTANTGVFTGEGSGLDSLAGANVTGTVPLATSAGTVSTAAQPAITSVGTLSGLTVTDPISGSITGTAGSATGTSATVTTAAQPNITSVGTLSGLSVTATIVGSVNGSAGTAGTSATVTTAAQPNITSVGTLSSVTTTGNVDTTANVVTDNIIGKTAGITITSIGTNQPVTLAPTGTGGVSVSSKRILDLAEPTASTDAATKQYVDDLAQGLAIQAPCIAGTPGTLTSITGGTITYNNGTAGVGATLSTSSGTFNTLDGISISTDDRVLVKNEAAPANNGIYVKTSATVLTRASDFDTPAEMAGGDFVFIQQGSTLNDTGFVMTDPVVTIGTDAATFVQFSGAGSFLAGAGLTLSGSTFSITDTAVSAQAYGNGTHNATFTVNSKGQMTAAANVQITAAAGSLSGSVLNSSVTGSSLTSVGTLSTGVWNASTIGSAYIATLNQNTTGSAGTVTTAAQPNITSVGTLTGLTVSSTIAGSVSGSAGTAGSATTAGTVTTAAQPAITSVGTLSGLSVSSTISGSVNGSAGTASTVTGAAQTAITSVGTLSGLGVNGTITASSITANTGSFTGSGSGISSINASNISSGTLAQARLQNSSLTVNGTSISLGSSGTITASTTQSATFNNSGSGVGSGTTFNGGTARTISYNTIGAPSTTGSGASGTWGINVSGSAGSAGSATTAGTVTTAAQPNITSTGTLSSLTVSGTMNAGTMQSTTITTGSAATAGTITGDYTLTSGSTLNATYADLAEKYTADQDYEAGTVVVFAGEAELSVTGKTGSSRVAGIITTNPAQVYNAECEAGEGEFVVELALIGRVPCKVIGPVEKGDLIVTSDQTGFGCAADEDIVKPGTIIGKAITGYNGDTPDGVCEVLVGRC